MVKTLDFGDRKVSFSTAFGWTFIYKAQFGTDPTKKLFPTIRKAFKAEEDDAPYILLEEIGLIGISEIAWCCAKLVDKSIPEPEEWVTSFDDGFPVMSLLRELFPEIVQSFFSTKNRVAPQERGAKRKRRRRKRNKSTSI